MGRGKGEEMEGEGRGKEREGKGRREEGGERKGGEGETRHTNPSLLPAPLLLSVIY